MKKIINIDQSEYTMPDLNENINDWLLEKGYLEDDGHWKKITKDFDLLIEVIDK